MCDDCVKFLTDAQAEAKSNTSFIDGLIENLENQCDLLGPGIADMVRTLIPFFFFPNCRSGNFLMVVKCD